MNTTKSPYTILIVDDVSKNIQILGNILSREDYQIAYAKNGEQALKIAFQQEFDLILLDIMMPGMDGYEVCIKLKKNESTKDIPIIFLTAKADMESIVKGFEIGGQDYITKPFNSAELLSRVRTHILLQKQSKLLKNINHQLEEKVAERTQQLENANQRLSILDKAKSDFLSIISHELRTPLNGLIGLTKLLDDSSIDNEQKEYLSYLKDVSARLVNFSDTALLITSLRINQYEPDLLPVSTQHLIESAIDEFKGGKQDHILNITSETQHPQEMILADSDLIRRSCCMIIDNSNKYCGTDSKLHIFTKLTPLKVCIIFEDNGPGFSKEALEQLFKLFSTTDLMHAEGTGLSLAAIKLIMDAHNANISVENKDGGGARVSLEFDFIIT